MLIAPAVVNNSGKRDVVFGVGMSITGNVLHSPGEREGKREQEAQKGENSGGDGKLAIIGKEDDVKVKTERTACDSRYDEGEEEVGWEEEGKKGE